MGQTAGGLPWPEDTDPVMAGAQATRALAEAIEGRPWWRAERVASFTLAGNGNDTNVGSGASVWELVESNFTPGDAQGFVTPRAGIWHLSARIATLAVLAGGNVVFCGIGQGAGAGLKEVGHQESRGTGGAQTRQVFEVNGVLRLAIGVTVRMYIAQNTGSGIQIGGGGNVDRWTTRADAAWLAP